MRHGMTVPLTRLIQGHPTLNRLYSKHLTHRLNYAQIGGARAMAASGETPTVKKRVVAGSFLFKFPNGDHKQARVALFRRSGKVSTYQHKLAPCSGSVEEDDASPFAAALREIREETTLPASSLELLRIGKPYAFADTSIGREWHINPFGFRLKEASEGGKGEEGITLDWEHDGIEWFDPMQVSASDEFGGVPRIVDSLRRVWPEYDLGSEAGEVLTDGLQRLRNDHEHGARELAGMGVSTLRDVISQMGLSQPLDEGWWSKVCMVAWHICQSRPSMGAAITSAMVKSLDAIRAVYLADMDAADKMQQITQALDQQLANRSSATDRICESFIKYVRQDIIPNKESKEAVSILTLSLSSTILECLLQAASTLGVALDLRVLESRPLWEGVTLASRILKHSPEESKLKVTVYSDASVALAAREVDVVLLGADRVSSSGDVSNKIGSLPTVLTARYVAPNAKVVVLSDTEKIAGPGSMDEHVSEENAASELSRAWKGTVEGAQVVEDALSRDDARVAIKNAYFEWVPAQLIDAYATEEGLWSIGQIRDKSAWVGSEIERYFKDL
ncbi:hypothetical protein F5Y14DRAFT_422610 [Nemania sp. NC0429]|nr:hypothetical protein F5Y14DRAFT_422610 [Nemania sp. NC0429]